MLAIILTLPLILAGCAKKEETSKTEEQTRKTETVAMQVTDPVCGMRIQVGNALKVEHGGTTYYFCAEKCREDFLKEPHKYIKRRTDVDPVCGKEIEHRPTIPHITARYQGKFYHFCSIDCKDRFEKEPEKFAK